jgi:adenylate kinase family enzyme
LKKKKIRKSLENLHNIPIVLKNVYAIDGEKPIDKVFEEIKKILIKIVRLSKFFEYS